MLIDGVKLSEYDLYYTTLPPIPTAEQDIEHVEIRGRHGSLTKKYGYKDIPFEVALYFYENRSFRKAYRLAKMYLLFAETLNFMDDEEVYYKIKSVRIDTAESEIFKLGMFTVEFTLAPFMYEIDNEPQIITSETTITNLGYESEPMMTVTASGTGNIYINDQEVTVKDINGTITIDSELQNAYRKESGSLENLNSHMIGDFPVLEHGENKISFDGDISRIELTTNWRWV